MAYGAWPYGGLGFGDQPDHDPPLVGSNLKGNAAYGRYPYGGFKERGADSILVNGGLEAGSAQVSSAVAVLLSLSGELAGVSVLDGEISLPPALSFAAGIASDPANVEAAGRVFIGGAGALVPDDAEIEGVVAAMVGASGILAADDVGLQGAIGALINASGALESGTAELTAEVLVFRRRRSVQAIAY